MALNSVMDFHKIEVMGVIPMFLDISQSRFSDPIWFKLFPIVKKTFLDRLDCVYLVERKIFIGCNFSKEIKMNKRNETVSYILKVSLA